MNAFEPGRVYTRQTEIHGEYGGQRFGGISTPRNHPMVFIFTGEAGEAFGYEDRFQPDGTFWYYGEGQVGDMTMTGGNRAIRDHGTEDKVVHLFEKLASRRYRYVGEATYLDHHVERAPDREGDLRDAFVFELDLTYPDLPTARSVVREAGKNPRYASLSNEELRKLAIEQPPAGATAKERRSIVRIRSEAVRVYVLRRANGVCEACGIEAPFKTKKGRPYLEPHHIRRIADGGPDHPRWVAALCPNCHREVHHGIDGDSLNARIAVQLGEIEPDDETASAGEA